MDTYGYLWILMDTYGYLWVVMDSSTSFISFMVHHGSTVLQSLDYFIYFDKWIIIMNLLRSMLELFDTFWHGFANSECVAKFCQGTIRPLRTSHHCGSNALPKPRRRPRQVWAHHRGKADSAGRKPGSSPRMGHEWVMHGLGNGGEKWKRKEPGESGEGKIDKRW